MPLYKVISVSTATVKTTYHVEARSRAEAERKIKAGDVRVFDEMVDNHRDEEISIELLSPQTDRARKGKNPP